MDLVIIILIVLGLILIWLNILGIVAVRHDSTLDAFQKKAQIALVILIPFLGAVLVLHLVNQHSPESIPQGLVPWPFKSLIFGRFRNKNQDRDTNTEPAVDLAVSRGQDRSYGSSLGDGGGDSGGGGD